MVAITLQPPLVFICKSTWGLLPLQPRVTTPLLFYVDPPGVLAPHTNQSGGKQTLFHLLLYLFISPTPRQLPSTPFPIRPSSPPFYSSNYSSLLLIPSLFHSSSTLPIFYSFSSSLLLFKSSLLLISYNPFLYSSLTFMLLSSTSLFYPSILLLFSSPLFYSSLLLLPSTPLFYFSLLILPSSPLLFSSLLLLSSTPLF